MTMTAESFLLGGEGIASAFTADDAIGTRRGGRITERPELRQQTSFDDGSPLTWDDGSPRMQLVVTVQTDLRDPSNPEDDGRRRFYIKGDLQKKTREALRALKANGLEVGGEYYVTRIGQDQPKKRGAKGAWLHAVEYIPAASTFLTADTSSAAPSAATGSAPAQNAAADLPYPAHLSPEQVNGLKAAGITPAQAAAMFPPPAH